MRPLPTLPTRQCKGQAQVTRRRGLQAIPRTALRPRLSATTAWRSAPPAPPRFDAVGAGSWPLRTGGGGGWARGVCAACSTALGPIRPRRRSVHAPRLASPGGTSAAGLQPTQPGLRPNLSYRCQIPGNAAAAASSVGFSAPPRAHLHTSGGSISLHGDMTNSGLEDTRLAPASAERRGPLRRRPRRAAGPRDAAPYARAPISKRTPLSDCACKW